MGLYMLFFPIAPLIIWVQLVEPPEIIYQYIKESAPNMYKLYINRPCYTFKTETILEYHLILFLHIISVFIIGSFFGIKAVKGVAANKSALSPNTYRMYKQFIIALLIQFTVPFLFILFPIAFAMYAILMKMENSKGKQEFS
uniref:Uncharacterized protein n=1 Tax=Panagrolaimus davidi TaxID=227884 RepID=A0A914PWK3_9BILA